MMNQKSNDILRQKRILKNQKLICQVALVVDKIMGLNIPMGTIAQDVNLL